MKTWFTIKAAAEGSPFTEISVFDYIGYYGVTAVDFREALKAVATPEIKVTINSPGGDVFEAVAIYNLLRASGKKITTVAMGIAASAASYLMLAGDHRVMPDNAMQMVHNASTLAYGNAAEMAEAVELLNKVDANLHATYAARSGMKPEQVAELLSKDTFLTAAECLELGLVDEVTAAVKVSAEFDIDRLPANVQELFKPQAAAVTTPPAAPATPLAEQVVAAATAAGLDDSIAGVIATDPKVTSMAEANEVIARAREIKALSKVARMDDKANGLILAGKTVPEVRAELNAALVAADEQTAVITARKTAATQPKKPGDDWSPTAMWTIVEANKAGSKGK